MLTGDTVRALFPNIEWATMTEIARRTGHDRRWIWAVVRRENVPTRVPPGPGPRFQEINVPALVLALPVVWRQRPKPRLPGVMPDGTYAPAIEPGEDLWDWSRRVRASTGTSVTEDTP